MIILAIGTNLGDRMRLIREAVMALEGIGEVIDISPIYETEPWGFESDNKFLNLVLSFESKLDPLALLSATQKIERNLGRKTKTNNEYCDRPIDIDIIDYNGLVLDTPELVLPHRHMHERNFVLYPLADIAPNWTHPLMHKTAVELKKETTDRSIPKIHTI